ncbi:MAG TPA: response regulator [Holophagaceae bacterium]
MNPGNRILCIEDNAMNWRLVQRLLSQAGYEMHWAEDGLKGCEMATELKPDLVLLDINLPGLSGFEVATKLRQDPGLEGLLIVALTAKTMRSDRETALVTGCDGFISKPIDPFLFVGQVEAYFGGHRDRLEQGREGAALRQFSQQVVEHLETQLRQAQEANQKLLEAQAALEHRNRLLSRLLALSRDIIPMRESAGILIRVLEQLGEDLELDRLAAYRIHPSGGYFQGTVRGPDGCHDAPVLPADHPMILRMAGLPRGTTLSGRDLRQSALWEPGAEAGFWDHRAEGLLLPLPGESGTEGLWGFLAASRDRAFLPYESEHAALHAGLIHVCLENAELIHNLDEASRALGTSYERLELAYVDLQKAQKALGAQEREAALGALFMNMAQRLQAPVRVLQSETVVLEGYMNRPDLPPKEERVACHLSMGRIQGAIEEVEGFVGALLRRAGQGRAATPEWIHLHGLLRQELDLMKAEGSLPREVITDLNLQASRDLLYGVYQDFAEILGHLAAHALAGTASAFRLRTWGGQSHFRLELEDEGGPLPPETLARAFEPFSELRSEPPSPGRQPGAGLPACAQLIGAYRGSMEIENTALGTRVRFSLPMD